MAESKATKIVMPHIESGYVSAEVPATSYETIRVDFTEAYSSAPAVAASVYNGNATSSEAPSRYGAAVGSTSTTGFSIRLYNNGTAARTLGAYWIAAEKTQ